MPVITAISTSARGHVTGVTTTSIVLPSAVTTYTDGDVDTHLNRSAASSGYVLSWNGSDYAWVAQSGGSGDNYYLDGITKSGNTLTFSVNGTTNQSYTFGSNAFNSTAFLTEHPSTASNISAGGAQYYGS